MTKEDSMMKKALISAALFSILLTAGASANWAAGDSTILAVNQGEAAFHTSLSSEQRLDVGMTSGETGSADLIFSLGNSENKLTLSSLPVKVTSGTSSDGHGYTDAKLTITPLINTDTGRRYYLVETGTPAGTQIISYSKGNFTSLFTASSLKDTADSASFEVGKKELLLHLTAGGTKEDYVLKYDSKTNTFTGTLKS